MTEPEPVVRLDGGTAHEALRAVAEVAGDHDAYVEADGSRLTFAEWEAAADATAAAFEALGVITGDIVTLVLPSSIDYAVCFQAAMRLGAITSGINPRLGPAEIGSVLRRSAPRIVVVDEGRELPDGRFQVVPRSQLAGMRDGRGPEHLPRPDPDRPVALVWTSGTTGDPKGAIFDHRNLAAVSEGAGPLRAAYDRRISPNPFSHVGYMTHLTEEIEYAITAILPPTPWKAEAVLAQMATERATVGQGVPSQWRLILDRPEFSSTDLSSLRICGTGAAPVPPAMVREMQEKLGCPVVIGYTSTEAALTTGSVPGDSPEVIANTVGRARDNVEVRVVDDNGVPVPTADIGNVECRSPAVMRGYWGDPERTAEVIGSDGWLRTGDSGWLDDAGYLTLVGRRKEMYLRGGYNIYPVEVERVVSNHPAVAQVAIVSKPDPVLGEIGVAFVVPAPGTEPPTRDEIRRWSKGAIADYKAPDLVELVTELPLTAMGKVDKRVLSERALQLTRAT